MKKAVFKVISVVLAVVMLLSVTVPAYATVNMYDVRSKIPVILISGDGNTIYDKDGNELSKLSKLFTNNGTDEGEGIEKEELYSSVANVLLPFFVDGVAFDNWEPYFENLQKEVSELFGDIILDENGEASNGSDIAPWCYEQNQYHMTTDCKGSKGYYDVFDYQFWYDWRLDPIEIADKFNEYIKGVKQATGAEKVSILCRCLGTNVIMAYIEKYGFDDIYGIGMDGTVCMGAEPLSESLSGNFKIDGNAINRVLADVNSMGTFNINSFVLATINLAESSGALDAVVGVAKELLYEKLVKGVTSALTLAAVSYPCYWACVSAENFDTAIEYVFGDEGSKKRETYAGLIEKITTYNEKVKKHIPEIMKSMSENGVKVGLIAKYGFQIVPICESRNKIADSFVSVESASFGATAGTVYETLSDKYISQQTEKGLAKYISPDKQVDASTCIYPDYTWFIKGVKHSEWTDAENKLLMSVITADRQLTVDDFEETQFMVRDPEISNRMVAMNEDNCNTEVWDDDMKSDKPQTTAGRLWLFIKSVLKWLKEFFNIVLSKLGRANAK